jgi:cytoskeleton protein RodZ
MAPVRDSIIGVGPALRKARETRRLSLDEASRDTKLTVDRLRALEEEDFEALLGDPYVRGSLRTYAQYLGLNPNKVAEAYARHSETPSAPPPPGKLGRIEQAIAATRIRDNQRLLIVVAGTLIVVAGVFGLVSSRNASPPPAALDTAAVPVILGAERVEAVLVANHEVDVVITVDGASPATYHLMRGETRSFAADTALVVSIAKGRTVALTVNGVDVGTPGRRGEPWERTFTPGEEIEGVSPSPGAVAGG